MPVIYMDRASIDSLTEKDIRKIIDENTIGTKYKILLSQRTEITM